MFENIVNFFRSLGKSKNENKSKDAAKERLHLVLMQDRANISADFLALMKQEIIEVIKKYIDVDDNAIDVRLTNKSNEDGTTGAPVLYANIPIVSVKEEAKEEARKIKKEAEKEEIKEKKDETKKEEVVEEVKKDETQEVIEKAEEIVEEIQETIEEQEDDEIKEDKKDEEENVNN